MDKEKIDKNIKLLDSVLEDEFSGERKEQIISMFGNGILAKRYFSAPASSRKDHHSPYDGGLLDHSLRVTYNMLKLNSSLKAALSFESIYFVGLFHDLGKIGDPFTFIEEEGMYYIPQNDQWRRDKLGEFYTINPLLGNGLSHSQRSIRILSQFNIEMNEDEHLAILHHAMLNCEENKYISFSKNKMLRITNIADSWSAFVDEV